MVQQTKQRKNPGKRLGRPVSRLVKLETIPTHCPESVHRYLQAIRPYRYRSMTAMYEDMLTRFLETRPWMHGINWRKPSTSKTLVGTEHEARTGWTLVNVQVPKKLKDQVKALHYVEGVSMAAIVFTAMVWWSMYIMPPSQITGGDDTG